MWPVPSRRSEPSVRMFAGLLSRMRAPPRRAFWYTRPLGVVPYRLMRAADGRRIDGVRCLQSRSCGQVSLFR
jgi:hypothetical protein